MGTSLYQIRYTYSLYLTQRTVQQGGYLLRKLQKQWKQQLATYHLTRKAIYLSQHDPT
jgi:hypothetical protein